MTTDDLIKLLKKHPKKEVLIYDDGVFKRMCEVKSYKVDSFCNWTFGANIDESNKDVTKENCIVIL